MNKTWLHTCTVHVLCNRNYLFQFRLRLRKSFGSGSRSILYIAVFQIKFVSELCLYKGQSSTVAQKLRKLSSQFSIFLFFYTFIISFYVWSGSKSGMHSDSRSAKTKSSGFRGSGSTALLNVVPVPYESCAGYGMYYTVGATELWYFQFSKKSAVKYVPYDRIHIPIQNKENLMWMKSRSSELRPNGLRSPGIDSQPGPRYDNPIWPTGPPGYISWRNRFLGIDSWTSKRLQRRALVR